MKTALTELIEELNNKANALRRLAAGNMDRDERSRLGGKIEGVELAIHDAKRLLPQERQQIEDALLYGHAEATHTSPLIDLSFTDRYFTEKFEQ
jgi:hypothetical protein